MHVRNTRDLGLLLRDRRRRLGLTQADVAACIGASRHWVMGIEAGKSTAELGLVLNALSAVGLVMDLRIGAALHNSADAAAASTLSAAQSKTVGTPHTDSKRADDRPLPRLDLDAVLAKTRTPRGDRAPTKLMIHE